MILDFMDNNVPNFDAMTKDELMSFWFKYSRASRSEAAELVGHRRPGFTIAVRQLANYAANKGAAASCRLQGNIQGALCYENICDSIYDALPQDVRW